MKAPAAALATAIATIYAVADSKAHPDSAKVYEFADELSDLVIRTFGQAYHDACEEAATKIGG